MRVFIVSLAFFVAAASAAHLPAISNSSQFRTEDDQGNYNFGYDESHATGATSRREEQINGVRRGMYSLDDVDGRRRIVHYVADAAGFRANIQTNEPGVELKDPADVSISNIFVTPAPIAVATPTPAPALASAPVTIAGPIAIEAPAPRAFNYSFGSTHPNAASPVAS